MSNLPYRSRPSLECVRCGNRQLERLHGWFRDDDYRELLAEYFEMERRARRAEARLAHEKGETEFWKREANWTMEHLQGVIAALIRNVVA